MMGLGSSVLQDFRVFVCVKAGLEFQGSGLLSCGVWV